MVEVNLLKATTVTVTVDRELTGDSHSFKQWMDTDDGEQVQIEAGFTHFTADGDRFVFKGVRWFPQLYDDYRDATVDLHRLTDDHHIASIPSSRYTDEFRLSVLLKGLAEGHIEPASALDREGR